MLRQLLTLSQTPSLQHGLPSKDPMTILNFNLVPGGISRSSSPSPEDAKWNEAFSKTLLEALKLLLDGSLIRKKDVPTTQESEVVEIKRLMGVVDEAHASGKIEMGGVFPQVVARKTGVA